MNKMNFSSAIERLIEIEKELLSIRLTYPGIFADYLKSLKFKADRIQPPKRERNLRTKVTEFLEKNPYSSITNISLSLNIPRTNINALFYSQNANEKYFRKAQKKDGLPNLWLNATKET